MSDQQYLLSDQYKDTSNLDARIQLHQRFSTNPADWQRWVFEQFEIAAGSRVLELGSGPAHLWRKNLDRVPQDWQIVLSDFSEGMLREARTNLAGSSAHSWLLIARLVAQLSRWSCVQQLCGELPQLLPVERLRQR